MNRIVILAPLTGKDSTIIPHVEKMIKLADIKNWIITLEDTRSDSHRFLALINYWIKRGVRFFIGGFTSSDVELWNIYMHTKNIVLISPSSTAVFEDKAKNVLRLVPSDRVTASVISTFIQQDKLLPDIGILAYNTIFSNSLIRELLSLIEIDPKSIYTYDDISTGILSILHMKKKYWIVIDHIHLDILQGLRQKNDESIWILPDLLYNPLVVSLSSDRNVGKILASGYIGASTITSTLRSKIQTFIYNIWKIYATTIDLNVYDTLRFFDMMISPSIILDNVTEYILSRMIHFYGATGNFSFDIENDRNNDAFSIGRVRNVFSSYIWEDLSYTALKDTIERDGYVLSQTLSSFPPLALVSMRILSPIDQWDSVSYTNLGGMTYRFDHVNDSTFYYLVTTRLTFIYRDSDNYIYILIPPTASNGTTVSAGLVIDKDVFTYSINGNDRILDMYDSL